MEQYTKTAEQSRTAGKPKNNGHNATPADHTEGPVAKAIEDQTAKIPSDLFLWAAAGTMATAIGVMCTGRKHVALLIGQFVAPLLIMGLYDKIVKTQGHDQIQK